MTIVVAGLTGTPNSETMTMRQMTCQNVVDSDQAKGRFMTYLEENFPDDRLLGTLLFALVPDTGIDPALVREFFAARDAGFAAMIDEQYVDIDRTHNAEKALREAAGL